MESREIVICCYCFRTREGNQPWKVRSFFSIPEEQRTYGICPVCQRERYPELVSGRLSAEVPLPAHRHGM